MSAFGNIISIASELTPKDVRTNSILRGKDRKVPSARGNPRALGLYYYDIYPFYEVDNPPPANVLNPLNISDVNDARAYYLKWYNLQVNCHLETDPILATVDFGSIIHDDFLPDGVFVHWSRYVANSVLVTTFKTNANLPANKNVYFVITGDKPDTPVYNGTQYIEAVAGLPDLNVGYGIYPQHDYTVREANFFGSAEICAIYRTDSNGKIQNIDQIVRGFKYMPNVSIYIGSYPQPAFFSSLKLEVREIKDRYDTGDGLKSFYTRRYQELTDNNWDTKVATDA